MATEPGTLRAILFDYGGVLAEEGFREGLKAIARRHGLDAEAFFQLGAEAVYASGYVTGEGSEASFWERLCRQGGLSRYDPAFTTDILERFVLRPAMLTAVRSLRGHGYRVAILSDQTDWLDRLNGRDRFFHEFDRVFNSYHLGKGKRDPSLFDDAVIALGVAPEQALFIDDNAGHVQRAASRGLPVILFADQEQCLAELEERLGHPLENRAT